MNTFVRNLVCLVGLAAMGCETSCPDSLFCLNPFTDGPLCQQYCEEQICEGASDVKSAGCSNPFSGEPSECFCECVSGGGTCDLGRGGGTGGTGGAGGLGGLGDSCQSTDDCDPNASSLGVFCCTEDAATCGNNLGECVEDCSQFSSGGEVGMAEGALCQDNNECGVGLFCCVVPDAAGNCDFALDQSCTCRSDQGGNGGNSCADVTPGNGGFGQPCRNDGDCNDGLPCCTSTEVSEACGVEVGLCECI